MRTVLLAGAALLLLARPGMAQQLDAAIAAPPLRTAPLRTALQVAPAAAASSPTAPLIPVTLDAGSGRVLTLGSAVANVFVADPKVAEVRPASTTTLFVFGTAPGRTTLAAMDAAGHVVGQFDLIVRPSGYGAALAGEAVGRAMPGSGVHVETTGAGLAVTGQVATAAEAERVMSIARAYATDKQVVDNRLTVAAATQVSLRVRIAEMSRSVSRELGLNWVALQGLGKYAQIGLATSNMVTATTAAPAAAAAAYAIGNTGFDGVIEALAQDSLVHMLAEPTLTTMSGEPASFLVGGEFPIPVAGENNTITVAFKQYGVKLAFVPTVIDGGRINIHVQPEVSQLTNQGAVQVSTGSSAISIPGVTMRRADTTVEVGSGDSFAIAGLLQENVTDAVSAVPLLGELPIIGPLFRSDSFQRNESELVIIVTPFIVRPVRDPAALHTPDETFVPPTDLERLLLLRQTGATADARPPHIPGAAGFIVQ
jgi:pilus assembly protein CpaC